MNAHRPQTLPFGRAAGCQMATGSCDTSAAAGIFQADPALLHENYCHEDNKALRAALADQSAVEGVTLSSCSYDGRQVGCVSPLFLSLSPLSLPFR